MTYNKYSPYIHQTLNTMEKLSVICSILLLAFGLPFRIDAFGIAQYRTGLGDYTFCDIWVYFKRFRCSCDGCQREHIEKSHIEPTVEGLES